MVSQKAAPRSASFATAGVVGVDAPAIEVERAADTLPAWDALNRIAEPPERVLTALADLNDS